MSGLAASPSRGFSARARPGTDSVHSFPTRRSSDLLPDFHLTAYRQLQIVVATHKLDGLTENDFLLAELLDKVPIDYSPKWLREHPEAQGTAQTKAGEG